MRSGTAIAGRVLGRDDLLDASRKWLLAVAGWDPKGATSRAYNDEAGFRIVVALARAMTGYTTI